MPNPIAPIVLFVYNRPWHTRQTLEALSKNQLADKSELFVFADGPKENASIIDIQTIEEVRMIVKEKKWCKSVKIIELKINKGLADSIVEGVTKIVNEYGKIIVLEDDIVTSPGFLNYMNDALNVYADEEKVMHVSGYMFPVKGKLPATFFYNTGSCWGWGTWARAWKHLDLDAKKLADEILKKKLLKKFNVNNSYNFFTQLEMNISGSRKTWAIKWYSSFFLKGGFALHPGKSLANNIGHDSSGDNCGAVNWFHWDKLADRINVEKIKIKESPEAVKQMIQFNKSLNKKDTSLINDLKHSSKLVLSYVGILPLIAPVKDKELKQIENNKQAESKQLAIWKQLNNLPRYTNGVYNDGYYQFDFVDAASFKFMYSEIFKDAIYNFKSRLTNPLIIDCGANIGLSILYFKKIHPHSHIIAFEPDIKIFTVLEKNISQNKLSGIELVNKALWKEDTTLHFYSEGADGGRIQNDNDTQSIIKVETVRLKSFLKDKKVDFLKIDIEGAETDVLLDCEEYLSNVENIFVEYHSFENRDQTLHQILGLLTKNGFRYYISQIGVRSQMPFNKINSSNSMDNQLNIFAYRVG